MALYLGRQKIAPVVNTIDVALADATESDVRAGKTFFSGNDEIKTGTLVVPDLSATTATAEDVLQGKKFYNAQGEFVEGNRPNKLNQYLNRTIEHITKEDLYGITDLPSLREFSSLKTVGVPDTVTYMPTYWCRDCANLETVIFDEDIQLSSFNGSAFYKCKKLRTVNIPPSITSIGTDVFRDCSSLEYIKIPSLVTELGSYSFQWCSALKTVEFEENSQLTTLGEYAFTNCLQLVNINLSDTILTSLKNGVFSSCSKITEITLPATVTTIGRSCFDWCSALKSITILATTPPTLSGSLWGSMAPNAFERIYIPAGTLSAYESATNWSSYAGKFVELEA